MTLVYKKHKSNSLDNNTLKKINKLQLAGALTATALIVGLAGASNALAYYDYHPASVHTAKPVVQHAPKHSPMHPGYHVPKQVHQPVKHHGQKHISQPVHHAPKHTPKHVGHHVPKQIHQPHAKHQKFHPSVHTSAQIFQNQAAFTKSHAPVTMKQQGHINISGPFHHNTSASGAQMLHGFGPGMFQQQQGLQASMFSQWNPWSFPYWGGFSW